MDFEQGLLTASQTPHHFRVVRHGTIHVDMPYRYVLLLQRLSYKLAPVAVLRPLLTAQETDAQLLLPRPPQASNPLLVSTRTAHSGIVNLTVPITSRIPGSAAEKMTHKHVPKLRSP